MPRQRNRATDRIGGGQGLERRRARRRRRCGWRSGGAKARRTVSNWELARAGRDRKLPAHCPRSAAAGQVLMLVERYPRRRLHGPGRALERTEGALAAGSKRVGRQAEKRWRAGALAP